MAECLVIFSFTFRVFFFLVNFKSPYITMAKENFIRYILVMRLILNKIIAESIANLIDEQRPDIFS